MARANINWLRAAFFPELAEDIQNQDDVANFLPGSPTSIADYPLWIRILVSFFAYVEYLVVGLVTISLSAVIAVLGFNLRIESNSIFWMLMGIAAALYFADTVWGTVRSSLIDAVVTGVARRLIIWVPGIGVTGVRLEGPARVGKTLQFSRIVHVLMESTQDYFRAKKERTLKIHPENPRGIVGEDLTITVTDADGNPVPDATVELGDQVERTNHNGRVELSSQEAGSASLVAYKEDDSSNRYQTSEIEIPIERRVVELWFEEVPRRAEAKSEIELQVVDELGEPVEDVEIEIDSEYVPPTDSRGRTMVFLPKPGTFEIRAQKPATTEKIFEPASAVIEVGPREVQFDEYPEVVQPGEQAHFRVTDEEGNPVSNAMVSTSRGDSIQTDEEGWVSITFDMPGLVQVSATIPEFGATDAEKAAEISVRVESESLFRL